MKLNGIISEYGYPVFEDIMVINRQNNTGLKMHVTIDTGAYGNFLKKQAAEILQLSSIGKGFHYNPLGGKIDCDVYQINILFDSCEFKDIEVQNLIQDNYPTDLILGVQFIRLSKFIYDGENGLFTIEFP